MANSTTNLDLISSSQASKEVTANALFDAESPAALYGRRASTTANLTWGYYGGALSVNGVVTAIPNGTKTLTNGATNYLEADPTTGNVSVNTANFTAANIPLYSVVCAGNVVTGYTDYRTGMGPSIIDTVTVGITANGSTLATATALTTIFNKISTANTGTGVRLPAGLVSPRSIYIDNDTANAVNVYPFAGAAINALAANAPYVIPAGSGGMFTYTATNQFDTFLAGSGGANEVFTVAPATQANHAMQFGQSRILSYTEATTNQSNITTAANLTSLTANVTVSSGQSIEVTAYIPNAYSTVNGDQAAVMILEDGVQIQASSLDMLTSVGKQLCPFRVRQPSAGVHNYTVQMARQAGTGTLATGAAATLPAFLLINLL